MAYDTIEKLLRVEDQVENTVPLVISGFSYSHPAADFHDIAAVSGRLNVYGREAELEPGNIMGQEVNNIILRGGLESIL